MADFQSFGSIDGDFDGCLSDLDRGFAYGDGLFETARLEQGRLPLWSLHRQRLLADAQRLQLSLDPEILAGHLNAVLAEVGRRKIRRGVLKVVVSRGQGGRGYQPSPAVAATIVIRVHPFPSYPSRYWNDGVTAFVCEHRLGHNPRLSGIKHLNKLDYVLATLEWRETDCAEGILRDGEGQIIEACSRNLFAVKGHTLLTPSLHNAGVAGILRKRILEDYAGRLGLVAEESTVGLDQLLAADEILLGNSVTGVWPVKNLRDSAGLLPLSGNTRVARQLQALFENDLQAGISENHG